MLICSEHGNRLSSIEAAVVKLCEMNARGEQQHIELISRLDSIDNHIGLINAKLDTHTDELRPLKADFCKRQKFNKKIKKIYWSVAGAIILGILGLIGSGIKEAPIIARLVQP
jgi:septation ring formation regulator EzrA